MMRLSFSRCCISCGWIVASLVTSAAGEAPRTKNELAEAMQNRKYHRAVDVVEQLLAQDSQPGDYLLFLKGRALHFAGNDREAVDTFRLFEFTYADSQWKHHVRFAMAISLARLGDFQQAEEIYRSEAEFLLSEDRKQEIADIYTSTADELFEPPTPEQKPDYDRALQFYLQALEVGTKPDRTAEIELRIARCQQLMGKHGKAVKQFEALIEQWPHDPLAVEARFRLGECRLSMGQSVQARRVWEDLLAADIPDGGWSDDQRDLRATAAFRIAATFELPTPPNTESLTLGIKSLDSFVNEWPGHQLVDDAFLLMARSYESAGRFEDAETVLGVFLSNQDHRECELYPEARFLLGRCQQLQKKFNDALATWRNYLRDHPTHGKWSDAQRLIIDTEYLLADDLRASHRFEQARSAYLEFLAKYPIDPRASATIFLLGQMRFEQEHWKEAVADWRHVVTKYPNSDIASRAQLMIATTIEEQLDDPERALQEYKKLTWGPHQKSAQRRIQRLTSKQITIRTKHVFRSSQVPAVTLTSRNVESVEVRVYAIDLETYFRKMHLATGVESLDVSLINPDHTLEFEIPNYRPYSQTELDIPLAASNELSSPSGVYVVSVSSDTLEATTMVLHSDLDIIVKGSRHEVFVYAQNMRTGEPWSNVRLLISDGHRLLGEGTTGRDGVFHREFPQLGPANDVRVFAAVQGNTASNVIALQGLQTAQGLSPRGYVYTDRAAYRPGQLVNLRAMVRSVAGDAFRIDAGKKLDLTVIDPRNRVVWHQELVLSEWGTTHDRFVLPESAPHGNYRVILTDNDNHEYQGGFIVQSFQLHHVSLDVESARDVYYRGERIRGSIKASYIYGGAVSNTTIRYQLGSGRTHTATTNKEGRFDFELETREFQETQQLPLRVVLPDLNLTVVRQFFISATGYSVAMETPRPCYLSGEVFPLNITTIDAGGEPVARSLTVRVFQRSMVRGQTAEALVAIHPIETDDSGRGQLELQLSRGATYVLRAEGEDRFGNLISSDHTVRISAQNDDVRLRILADQLTYNVGETAKIRLHWRESSARALITYQGARVLGYQIVPLKTGENMISLPLRSEHSPNFELHVAIMTDDIEPNAQGRRVRFHTASNEFFVRRVLTVSVEAMQDGRPVTNPHPGKPVHIRVTTHDSHGNPVSAELSLAMIQQALVDRFGETASQLGNVFQATRRGFAVRTGSSINFSYQPTTTPISGLVLAERDRLIEEAEMQADRELNRRRFDLLEGSPPNGSNQLESHRSGLQQSVRVAAQLGRQRDDLFAANDLDGAAQLNTRSALGFRSKLQPWPADSTVVALHDNGILNHVAIGGRESDWRQVANEIRTRGATIIHNDASRETGYWNPIIVTDDGGTAVVELTMPDVSTAWRLLARGITKDTTVGEQSLKLVARKKLFGYLRLPLAFTDGDQVRIPATIHKSPIPQGDVTATLKVKIGARISEFVQTLSTDGWTEREIVFDLQMKRAETHSQDPLDVEFELIVAADGHLDRRVYRVPIHAHQTPIYASASGSSTGDTTVWTKLPDDVPIHARSMRIVIGPSVEQSLLDILFGLPVGDLRMGQPITAPPTDSSTSDLMAALALQTLFSDSRQAEQPHARTLDRRIRSEISRLVSSQLDDGGWGWAGNRRECDRNISARTIWALAMAKAAGYQISDEIYDKGLGYLTRQLAETANTDYESKAVLLHALAAAGKPDFALANRLYRNRPSLSTSALIHLALAFNEMDRPPLSRDVLQLVKGRNMDDLAPRREPVHSSLPWSHSATELRALLALALQGAGMQPEALKGLIDRLHQDRQGLRWSPDKATGPATLALCRWLGETKLDRRRYSLAVQVNGQHVKDLIFDSDTPTQTINVPKHLLSERGKQNVKFLMSGRGHFTYQCVLRGFTNADKLKSTTSDWRVSRTYEQAQLERNGKRIPRGFDLLRGGYRSFHNSLSQLPLGRSGHVHLRIRRTGITNHTPAEQLEYLILTEPVPAGVAIVKDSISGTFDHYEISRGVITFYISNRIRRSDISFAVHGYLAGDYRAMPTIVRDAYRPERIAVTETHQLKVLPKGSKSEDAYRMTPRELFELGRLAYQNNDMRNAAKYLEELTSNWNLRPEIEQQATRMLLDASLAEGPAHKVVHYFEIVKEKYPEMEVPHDKILRIGQAYHEMGEFERCFLIFRATVESSFMSDSRVAGFLEKQGQTLRGVDFMNDLLMQYPPEPYAAAATFDLAQQVYTISAKAKRTEEMRNRKITRQDLVRQSGEMLDAFLTRHPDDPAADQAAFSYANVLLDLEEYEKAIAACRKFTERYSESDDLDGFWYTIGYCHFALGQHSRALEICRKVAQMERRDSKSGRVIPSSNRDRAIYILGQIYHSLGKAPEAIAEYSRVSKLFSDAQEAIDYFTHKAIELPEVTRVTPGERVEVGLKFRNITNCIVQVYRIDLMKYGVLQRNLADITSINLAGIRPLHQEQIELGDGKDYRDRTRPISLPLKDEGAYLVVCRGQDLHTSGLVLVAGLRVDVQEEIESGRVRATVRELESGDFVPNVHVKVIGSCNDAFVSGETDLRGVFVADGIQGESTVIAQSDRHRYAFSRGSTFLGPTPKERQTAAGEATQSQNNLGSYGAQRKSLLLESLKGRNSAIQLQNYQRQQQLYYNNEEGVRVEAVK